MSTPITRRQFMAAGIGAWASLSVLPRSVIGANGRLNVAYVGAGGKGNHAIKSTCDSSLINMVAFADVDEVRAEASYKEHPTVPVFKDFRVMLDKMGKDIDAVLISTPDHSHHYITKTCMLAGKHVYVEKPLAHSIQEVRDLADMEKKYPKLACQMGNQGHSGPGIALLDLWIKAGVLGEIQAVHAWTGTKWAFGNDRPATETPPATLDWDQWLGPAAQLPYSKAYCPGKWRGWNDFGCGAQGDWWCHNADAPYFALGLDLPNRIKLESSGPSPVSFPMSVRLTYSFPRAGGADLPFIWTHGPDFPPFRPADFEASRKLSDEGGGTLVIGSKATVLMASHAGVPRIIPEAKHKEAASTLPKFSEKRSAHFTNWFMACMGQEKTRSDFAYSARLTEAMHYGLIAQRVNADLVLDPATRTIVGNPAATALMNSNPRAGWTV
jgi:hypothetical protein